MKIEQTKQLIDLMLHESTSTSNCLLSLFDILNQHLLENKNSATPPPIFDHILQDFCSKQAEQLNAHHPAMLAEHILLIAKNAFDHQLKEPQSQSLLHAKQAASALIAAQTETKKRFSATSKRNVIFASIATIAVNAFIFWPQFTPKPTIPVSPDHTKLASTTDGRAPTDGITANEAAAMYSKFEMMRKGTCRYLEALQIPDQDKAVYLENVVGGKVPTNLGDLAKANAYLEKIHCTYTPMLMKTSQ